MFAAYSPLSAISRRFLGWLAGMKLCLAASAAFGGEPAAQDWQLSVTPYFWATSLNGDLTVRGRAASVSASFTDILRATDSIVAVEGHGEAWKGNWGVYIDGIYNRLEVTDRGIAQIAIGSVIELSILEAGILYRIANWPLMTGWSGAPPDAPRLELDAYGGASYTSLDIAKEVTVGGVSTRLDSDQDWVDPLVGLRAILTLDRRWQLMLGGDIGGFGAGSDFSWSAVGLAGYRYELFGFQITSVAGYKALSQDFQDGGGIRRVEWDMIMHGPIIGSVIRF